VNPQKAVCELAYGASIVITEPGGTTYKSGVSITSACATRRSTTISLEAIVPQLYTQAAQIAAAALTPTTFAAALQTAAAATNVTLTNIVVTSTTQTAGQITTTSSDDNTIIIIACSAGGGVLLLVCLGVLIWYLMSPKPAQGSLAIDGKEDLYIPDYFGSGRSCC